MTFIETFVFLIP